ncbi:MAG: hypothetical protein ACM3N6_10190 [Betaproteobacteria bacterium]
MLFGHFSIGLGLMLAAAASLAQQPPATAAPAPAASASASKDCVRPRAMHGTDKTSMPMPMLGPCQSAASASAPKAKPKQAVNGR